MIHCRACLLVWSFLPVVLACRIGLAQEHFFALTEKVKLREHPDKKLKPTLELHPRNIWIVSATERQDNWVKLKSPSGTEGWVTAPVRGLIPIPPLSDAEGNPPLITGSPGLVLPQPLSRPLPQVPSSALGNRSGRSVLAVVIEKDGKVGRRALLQTSGDREFDRRSLEVLDLWMFKPAMLQGNPVSTLAIVETTFRAGP
jgi:TonB family protein